MLGALIGFFLRLFGGLAQASAPDRRLPPPSLPPPKVSFPDSARRRHMVVFGQSGTGKSRFLESFVIMDAVNRVTGKSARGFGIIDVHGDLYDNVRGRLAILAQKFPELEELIVLIDPTIEGWAVGYNPLELRPGEDPERKAQMLANMITTLFHDDPQTVVRMYQVARYTFLTLILAGMTLIEAPRLLQDREFRRGLVEKLNHPKLANFWLQGFPKSDRDAINRVESALNRLDRLVADPDIAPIFSGPSTINFRDLMDRGAIILIKAPKGKLGEGPAFMLCGFILYEIQQAALSRQDMPDSKRTPFTLVCDEFANYTTDTVRQIINESRKYGLELCLAAQEVRGQLKTEALQSAVLNTVGNLIAFRLGYEDADTLVKNLFTPDLDQVKATTINWQKPFGVDVMFENPIYRGMEEIWERERRKLTEVPDRTFWWKQRGKPGVQLIETLPVADLEDLASSTLLPLLLARQADAARRLAGKAKELKAWTTPRELEETFIDEEIEIIEVDERLNGWPKRLNARSGN